MSRCETKYTNYMKTGSAGLYVPGDNTHLGKIKKTLLANKKIGSCQENPQNFEHIFSLFKKYIHIQYIYLAILTLKWNNSVIPVLYVLFIKFQTLFVAASPHDVT